jgi:hypothetical protein
MISETISQYHILSRLASAQAGWAKKLDFRSNVKT